MKILFRTTSCQSCCSHGPPGCQNGPPGCSRGAKMVPQGWKMEAGVGEPDASRPAVGAAVGAAAEPSPVVVVTPALTPPTPPPGMERMLVVAWGPSVGFCASEEGGGDTEDVGCRVTRGETFLDIL